jgi:hypothetical protein
MQTHGSRIAAIIAALVVLAGAPPLAADPILVIVTSGSPFSFGPCCGESAPPSPASYSPAQMDLPWTRVPSSG